jgi:TolB protein
VLRLEEGNGTVRDLGRVASQSAFSWSPDARTLAVAEAVLPTGALYAGLSLLDVGHGGREALYAGPVGGFFWSPDGARILVIAPDLDTGEWRGVVVTRKTREEREVLRFLPSPESQALMLHFDQYALSHRLWSPDSSHFAFAGYPVDAGREGPARPTVWVVNAADGLQKVVGEGRSAFWSPR